MEYVCGNRVLIQVRHGFLCIQIVQVVSFPDKWMRTSVA